MTYVMLSVDTVAKAAASALNGDLDPHDLEGLNTLTRLNLLAALALAAKKESPAQLTMAVSADDFALLSSAWDHARDAKEVFDETELPGLLKLNPGG